MRLLCGRSHLMAAGAVYLVLLAVWRFDLTARIRAGSDNVTSLGEVMEKFNEHTSSSTRSNDTLTTTNSNNNSNNNSSSSNNDNNSNSNDVSNDVSAWANEQKSRRSQIQKSCQALREDQQQQDLQDRNTPKQKTNAWVPSSPKDDLSRLSHSPKSLAFFYVDDAYKLIYCNVPKVSSTQWKKMLILLRSSKYKNPDEISYRTTHFNNHLTTLSNKRYSPEDLLFRLETYTKILTIRHPMERLLSAYRDKFAAEAILSKQYHNMYGKKWIAAVRRDQNSTGGLQFDEMLEYLAYHSQATKGMDGHWRPISDLCYPCTIQYDFISNFSSQQQDNDHIMSRIVQGSEKSFLRFPTVKASSTGDVLKEILSTLDQDLVRDVQKTYYSDYETFGFKRLSVDKEKHN